MIFYGWRRLEDIPEELYQWVPRMEQLEVFPQSDLTSPGTDGIFDSEVSVSAMSESEAQDVMLLDKLQMVYPCIGGYRVEEEV